MKKIKSSLFLNLFLKIAVILAAFVVVIIVASSTVLYDFYFYKEKNNLITTAGQLSDVDITDTQTTSDTIESIAAKNGFQIEIYDASGRTYYTTESGKMMDFLLHDRNFNMIHSPLRVIESSQIDSATVFQTAADIRNGSEYLVVVKSLGGNYYAELKIQKDILSNNAAITGEFTVIVAVIFLVIALVWTFFTARGTAKPITDMNKITRDMAALDFSERLKISSRDEIGELAGSINNMADSLSCALSDLQKANAQLKNDIELERLLDTMRREFVANVSHELKTPLSIISGYAEGLKLNVNSAEKDRYCDTIIDETDRMNNLVLSILELSRYESGQVPVNRQAFEIAPLIDTLGGRIFADSDINFVNDVSPELLIKADPSGIEQVLKSYLENARAHTPTGGTVRVYSGEQNGELRFGVLNTGSHIDEEKIPYIWQSFYRGDASHKRESDRFGLGLSIVAAIMKLHGFKYGVFNTNEGVCFWFSAEKIEN